MSAQPLRPSERPGRAQLTLLLRFGLVGLSGVGVNLGALALISALGFVSTLASALAIELSIISNFLLNDRWTFAAQRSGAAWSRALRFQLVSLVGALMQWATFVLMGLIFALSELSVGGWARYEPVWREGGLLSLIANPPELGVWQYLAQLVGVGVATSWNFLVNLNWTWRRTKEI